MDRIDWNGDHLDHKIRLLLKLVIEKGKYLNIRKQFEEQQRELQVYRATIYGLKVDLRGIEHPWKTFFRKLFGYVG
jgi:hypothetical protein